MVKLSLMKVVAVVVGGLALSLATGIGVASAQPDLGPLINTTCTYPQAMAALNAGSPDAAATFNASPVAQFWLRSFLASPPDKRSHMLQSLQGGRAQQYVGPALQAAATCNNF